MTLRSFAWYLTVLFTLHLTACGAGSGVDYDDGVPRDGRTDLDATRIDAGNCGENTTGTSQVMVSLQIEPGLDISPADVWLAAMCIDSQNVEHTMRVTQADETGAPTRFAGLPAGLYVVRAVALIVPGTSSPQLALREGATTVTTLTLAPGPDPIARINAQSPGVTPVTDAGSMDASASDAAFDAPVSDAPAADTIVAQDATVSTDVATDAIFPPESDAFDTDAMAVNDAITFDVRAGDATTVDADVMLPSGILLQAPIMSPGSNRVTGTFFTVITPRNTTEFNVQAFVRNDSCLSGSCVPIAISRAEMRVVAQGVPLGVAVATFTDVSVMPRELKSTEITPIAGYLNNSQILFESSLFGTLTMNIQDAGIADASDAQH